MTPRREPGWSKWARCRAASGSDEFGAGHSAFDRGQALVELAVFGSLFLFALGYLVSIVLGSDYQQQVKAEAFRRSLAANSVDRTTDNLPLSLRHLVIRDRPIPDPADPFGRGSPVPVIGQASVTRNYQSRFVPKSTLEIPRLAVQIENATGCPGGSIPSDYTGNPLTCYFTTAGFKTYSTVRASSLERYGLVFDDVCKKDECGGGTMPGCAVQETTEINITSGEQEIACVDSFFRVRVLDSCEGEIISYDGCLGQAAMLVDDGICTDQCAKGGRDRSKCITTCSGPVVELPWYAVGASCGGGRCTAPALDAFFAAAGVASMGVQPGAAVVVAQKNSIRKTESPGGVTSTTAVEATETTTRDVRWRGGAGKISARRPDQSTTTWSTSW